MYWSLIFWAHPPLQPLLTTLSKQISYNLDLSYDDIPQDLVPLKTYFKVLDSILYFSSFICFFAIKYYVFVWGARKRVFCTDIPVGYLRLPTAERIDNKKILQNDNIATSCKFKKEPRLWMNAPNAMLMKRWKVEPYSVFKGNFLKSF